jgi:hypothetical protein
MKARGLLQQMGNLFIGWRNANDIGRNHDNIVRIIARFGVQRGMHGCSVLSLTSPT